MTRGGPPPQSRKHKLFKTVEEHKTKVISAHQSASAGKDDRSTVPVRAGPPPRPQWGLDEPQFEMLTPPSKSKSKSEPELAKPQAQLVKPQAQLVKPPLARTWGRAGAPPVTRHKSDSCNHNRIGPIMMTVETTTSVIAKQEVGVPMILPREPPPRHDSLKRRDTPFTNTVSYYTTTHYAV